MHYSNDNDHVTLKRDDVAGWKVVGGIGGAGFLYITMDEVEAINIYQEKVQLIQRNTPMPVQTKDRVKLGCSPSTIVTELEVKSCE